MSADQRVAAVRQRTTSVEAFSAQVPMQRPFAHASHRRDMADSVLVRCEIDGFTGWGEGAPRPYVTGETSAGVLSALSSENPALVLEELAQAATFEDGVTRLARLDFPRLLGGAVRAPAAAAALETAALDAWCRLHDRPLRDALVAAAPPGTLLARPLVRPAALVVDLSRDPAGLLADLGEDAVGRLQHVKLKASADPYETAKAAELLSEALPSEATLSVDANCGWDADDALVAAELLAPVVAWIEEPTVARSWAVLRRIRARTGARIMLDESAVDVADLETASTLQAADAVNIRISKCGGILPALQLARRADELGIGLQLGVQVAEVGPLWAAGRLLAAHLRDPLAIEAGRQDEWFPTPLTDPPYRIDRSHHLAPPLDGPGLGLVPSPELLSCCRSAATTVQS
ncbi:enolase C-terminal domain-like protein [Streptomyces fractus]|uniref:enolase C-terminal domain-like protein n=1 Tax=Streptomyces fractus TaxID=641806 RepID=UPI003CFA8BF5